MSYYGNDGYGRRGIFSNVPPVTLNLIIINVFVYVITSLRLVAVPHIYVHARRILASLLQYVLSPDFRKGA